MGNEVGWLVGSNMSRNGASVITYDNVQYFVDKFVRPGEGVGVLLCVHTDHVQPAAKVYAGCVLRGVIPTVVPFVADNDNENAAALRAHEYVRNQARRVVTIVCDTNGNMLRPALDGLPEGSETYRVSGCARRVVFDN
jgi:hypothetical protein